MKWILITMLFLSAQAEATLIQYTFEVLTKERTGTPGGATDRADMTLLVDADSRQITKLRYTTRFFDIDFQGGADITAQFRWLNQDGSGYYGINSFMEGAVPDGTSINMFLEATMPINGNPAHFLNNGTDGQHFIFSTENHSNAYIGEWMPGEKIIVPEPATLSLLGLGLGVIGLRRYSLRAKKH
ncbi:PEP-CTERM sorting domain-containing protein [Marinobacter goseongensis]|uniref:PEP-CTERM sorting domain-containing protein n=1 Tax=Marinobacter goseongensis TaxID=453838 RepID=UPI00200309F8|nr:PEP-CTERM sorting domain-containing protein [Marinobacter goseongensis]MCK7549990.1 PEP-CTERM sorting domain-containing protein [Marinobacter goseongensis]